MTRLATATLIVISVITAAPARAAMPLREVVETIANSGGRYKYGSAGLLAADCSGLVSVAQTLAMGQPVRRLGDTDSLLAGNWPDAIPGAVQSDEFVIGSSPSHMVVRVAGVNLEARQSGEPFRVGTDARSPWDMPQQWHVDERMLVA